MKKYVIWSNIDLDNKRNLRATGCHHDGRDLLLYRVFKDDISETQRENFLDKIYFGMATQKDITRYTKRLGDEVCRVYGWE